MKRVFLLMLAALIVFSFGACEDHRCEDELKFSRIPNEEDIKALLPIMDSILLTMWEKGYTKYDSTDPEYVFSVLYYLCVNYTDTFPQISKDEETGTVFIHRKDMDDFISVFSEMDRLPDIPAENEMITYDREKDTYIMEYSGREQTRPIIRRITEQEGYGTGTEVVVELVGENDEPLFSAGFEIHYARDREELQPFSIGGITELEPIRARQLPESLSADPTLIVKNGLGDAHFTLGEHIFRAYQQYKSIYRGEKQEIGFGFAGNRMKKIEILGDGYKISSEMLLMGEIRWDMPPREIKKLLGEPYFENISANEHQYIYYFISERKTIRLELCYDNLNYTDLDYARTYYAKHGSVKYHFYDYDDFEKSDAKLNCITIEEI